ncbi:DGQHR domain-containing protein [Limnobacter thiooxidans]
MSVTLITQGKHKFYSGTMEIEMIAACCSPNPRERDPELGFQRSLDETRALAIANYIRNEGTIPSSIILSAQDAAELQYDSKKKTLSFNLENRSFLILDGQHRVYGFKKLMNDGLKYRVPVIIYNELTPIDEARIFIDINTLQKPVPKELLLDIKKLAERESTEESFLDELFTSFEVEPDSYLINKLSRFDKSANKISKVTFYDSLKPLLREFNVNDTAKLYRIINSYLIAAGDIFSDNAADLNVLITKATLFKILIGHAKSIISIISDNSPENIEKISEYKRYLERSLPGSIKDISGSKAYLKSLDSLDKKLLRRNVTI